MAYIYNCIDCDEPEMEKSAAKLHALENNHCVVEEYDDSDDEEDYDD